MRTLLFLLAACGGSSAQHVPDAHLETDGPPPGDGADASGAVAPQVLVPAMLGNVYDFAYTADTLYPILNIGGRLKLAMCPQQTCGANPAVIGDVGIDTRGRGVEIVGDQIYWLASNTQIMAAGLDGSNPHLRYDALTGVIEPRLRGDGGKLYFLYATTDYHTQAMVLDTQSTADATPVPGTLSPAGQSFTGVIDAAHGMLAVWHSIQGGASQPIQIVDLTAGTVENHGAAQSVSSAGLSLATQGVFFIGEFSSPSHSDLFACPLTSLCMNPPSNGRTFVATAAVDNKVFFEGRTADNLATVVSCDLGPAISGTCTPHVEAVPASPLDLLQNRAMRADATAIYVATDAEGAGSVWKIMR